MQHYTSDAYGKVPYILNRGTRQQVHNPATPAFLKLWSADHKWSSGSALVVLLD